MVKVSVHIVTFNSAKDVEACLESVTAQTFPSLQTRILDNASSDGTPALLERSGVEVVLSKVNTGFSKGHNDLIRNCGAEYVLILNPDAVLRPDFVAELVKAMDARPDAASATGKLLRFDGQTIDSTGIVMKR